MSYKALFWDKRQLNDPPNHQTLISFSQFSQFVLNPAFMTFLLTLIIAITLSELFKRAFKSRILGFLVTFTALIWIYGETVKDKTIFDVLVSMISLLAFFIAAFIVVLKLFAIYT